MLDINLIRESPDVVRDDLKKRGQEDLIAKVDDLRDLDEGWRKLKVNSEDLRHRRNEISREIARAKKEGKDLTTLLKEASEIPKKIKQLEEDQDAKRQEMDSILMTLPNILHDSVPVGADETANKVEREVGKKTKHAFTPKSHVDLLESLDLAETEKAAKLAGARSYFLKRDFVMLDLSLQKLALDILVKKGYTPIYPPFMMRRKPYEGVTDLEAFHDVLYKIENDDLYLIATSEHPLAALHMDEFVDVSSLPLRYAGLSTCFRKEAGSHGKDTKGIFRVHQFNKVEQFIFCRPDDSWKLFNELIANAEEFFRALELPYRIVDVCTGDIGSIAAKKYDLEVWMPVQKRYREAVSCSNCTDYQARRLKIRYKDGDEKGFVHTLNSTMVATGRAMVAILENFQQEDGSIRLPKALHPLMGKKAITPQ